MLLWDRRSEAPLRFRVLAVIEHHIQVAGGLCPRLLSKLLLLTEERSRHCSTVRRWAVVMPRWFWKGSRAALQGRGGERWGSRGPRRRRATWRWRCCRPPARWPSCGCASDAAPCAAAVSCPSRCAPPPVRPQPLASISCRELSAHQSRRDARSTPGGSSEGVSVWDGKEGRQEAWGSRIPVNSDAGVRPLFGWGPAETVHRPSSGIRASLPMAPCGQTVSRIAAPRPMQSVVSALSPALIRQAAVVSGERQF